MSDRTDSAKTAGQCLCGNVGYAGKAIRVSGFCYCTDCQRYSGSGYLPFLLLDGEDFEVRGRTEVLVSADTGLTRHFCSTCASPIFSVPASLEGIVIVYAGTLAVPGAFDPQFGQFGNSRCAWVSVPEGLEVFPGAAP